MAQRQAARNKAKGKKYAYRNGSEGGGKLPVLHEDNRLLVYKNSANEIFVKDIRSGSMLRISAVSNSGLLYHGNTGLQFTTNKVIKPIQIEDKIGWYVGPSLQM